MKTPAKKPTRLTREQRNFLELRILNRERKLKRYNDEIKKAPAVVIKARRVVESWHNGQIRSTNAHNAAISARANKCREALHFLSPEVALKRVIEFETK